MSKFNWEECWKAIQDCPGYTRKICTKAENTQEKSTINGKKELNHLKEDNSTKNKFNK